MTQDNIIFVLNPPTKTSKLIEQDPCYIFTNFLKLNKDKAEIDFNNLLFVHIQSEIAEAPTSFKVSHTLNNEEGWSLKRIGRGRQLHAGEKLYCPDDSKAISPQFFFVEFCRKVDPVSGFVNFKLKETIVDAKRERRVFHRYYSTIQEIVDFNYDFALQKIFKLSFKESSSDHHDETSPEIETIKELSHGEAMTELESIFQRKLAKSCNADYNKADMSTSGITVSANNDGANKHGQKHIYVQLKFNELTEKGSFLQNLSDILRHAQTIVESAFNSDCTFNSEEVSKVSVNCSQLPTIDMFCAQFDECETYHIEQPDSNKKVFIENGGHVFSSKNLGRQKPIRIKRIIHDSDDTLDDSRACFLLFGDIVLHGESSTSNYSNKTTFIDMTNCAVVVLMSNQPVECHGQQHKVQINNKLILTNITAFPESQEGNGESSSESSSDITNGSIVGSVSRTDDSNSPMPPESCDKQNESLFVHESSILNDATPSKNKDLDITTTSAVARELSVEDSLMDIADDSSCNLAEITTSQHQQHSADVASLNSKLENIVGLPNNVMGDVEVTTTEKVVEDEEEEDIEEEEEKVVDDVDKVVDDDDKAVEEEEKEDDTTIGQDPGFLTLTDLYDMEKKGQLLRNLDVEKVQKARQAKQFHRIFDPESNGTPVIIVERGDVQINGKPTRGIFVESNNRMCALTTRGIQEGDDVDFQIPVTLIIVGDSDFTKTWENTQTLSFYDNFQRVNAEITNRLGIPNHVLLQALTFVIKSCARAETLYSAEEQTSVILPLLNLRYTDVEVDRMRRDAIFRNKEYQNLVAAKILPPVANVRLSSEPLMAFLCMPLTRQAYLTGLSNGVKWPSQQNSFYVMFSASMANDKEASVILSSFAEESMREAVCGKPKKDTQQHAISKALKFWGKLSRLARVHNANKTPKRAPTKRACDLDGDDKRYDGSIKKVAKFEECADDSFVLVRNEKNFDITDAIKFTKLNYVLIEETGVTLRQLSRFDDDVNFQTSRWNDEGAQRKCLSIGSSVVRYLKKPSATYSSFPNLVNALMGCSNERKGCRALLFELVPEEEIEDVVEEIVDDEVVENE